jgi:phosphoribosylformylglycinamidine cyclo-ligase
VADELLKVHRCYEKQIRPILADDGLTGLAHITGGGILNNTARILPDGLALHVDFAAWTRPPVFDLIQKLGPVPEEDMRQTFNLGIGMIVVVRPDAADRTIDVLADENGTPVRIGSVTKA